MIDTLQNIGAAILIVAGVIVLLALLSIGFAIIKAMILALIGKKPTQRINRARIYTVREGETLFQICERAGVNWKDVMRLNALRDQDDITPGQRLLLSEQTFDTIKSN